MDEMSQNNIYPKTCTYGCGLQIYWNTSVNEYWEVLAQKKHICPSRPATTTRQATTSTGSTYYNKKPWSPKPKMSLPSSYCRVLYYRFRNNMRYYLTL